MLRRVGLLALVMIGTLATYGCQTTGTTRQDQSAQEVGVQSSDFSELAVVRIYDGVVKFPAPIWADDALTTIQLSKTFRDQKGPRFVLELIHKEDEFDQWKRLYSFSGTQNPNLARWGPDSYALRITRGYLSGCPENDRALLEPAWSENGARTMVVLCGNTAQLAGRYGYGADVGEVALMRFHQFENTLIMAQFAWRVPSFQIPQLATKSWLGVLDWLPIYDELIVMAERFKKISVVDSQRYEFETVPLKRNSQASAR